MCIRDRFGVEFSDFEYSLCPGQIHWGHEYMIKLSGCSECKRGQQWGNDTIGHHKIWSIKEECCTGYRGSITKRVMN